MKKQTQKTLSTGSLAAASVVGVTKENKAKVEPAKKLWGYDGKSIVEVFDKSEALNEKDLERLKGILIVINAGIASSERTAKKKALTKKTPDIIWKNK